MCNTVAYAHSRGVLHRDLKPGNIMLGEYGETLVVDWGLAKGRDAAISTPTSNGVGAPAGVGQRNPETMTGTAIGTPAFMSPEQAAGRMGELGPASDVYSLGATLYCVLTGRSPFEGPDTSMIREGPGGGVSRPRQVEPGVPVALEAVCLKAMALSPDGRYDTARALGDDIERWLADQAVQAYPEPFQARAVRMGPPPKAVGHRRGRDAHLRGTGVGDPRLADHEGEGQDDRSARHDPRRAPGAPQGLGGEPGLHPQHRAAPPIPRPAGPGPVPATGRAIPGGAGRPARDGTGVSRDRRHWAAHRPIRGIPGGLEIAIKELTALCGDNPGQEGYRPWLVETLVDRGELNHMNGRTRAAEEDFWAAIDHAEKLLSEGDAPSHRRAMASALIDLSEVLALKNQHAEAYAAADRAVGLLVPLARPDPMPGSTTRDRWLLSLALADRGVASMETGDRDRAGLDLDEAARIAGAVPQDDEVYDDSQFQLACVANHRAELLSREPSTLAESERSYEEASRILARLITNHKLIPHYREEMAVTFCGRAAVRSAMNRVPDARRDCEAALEHLTELIGEQAQGGPGEPPVPEPARPGPGPAGPDRVPPGTAPGGPEGPLRGGREADPGHRARPRTGGGQGEARTDPVRPGSTGELNHHDVMMIPPFPVPNR